ncbi:MAG: hypothetical protein RQ748_12275, partial [Elusimicrobiales bacterium]|nr:hypothetical protein [Elusimicrobiales bacterium]
WFAGLKAELLAKRLAALHEELQRHQAVVERLGFTAAPTVEAALAEARSQLGADAQAVVHTVPPVFTVNVMA